MASPSSDYLSMVLSFPNHPPISVLTIFFLGLMRIAPIVAFAPFLGSKLPGGVKIATALALTLILLPHLLLTTTENLQFNMHYVGYVFKELFLGLILALFASGPFFIASSSGVLIDFLRGSSALMVQDPLMQTQVSPIGILYNYVLVVIFFQLNGPFIFLDAVYHSFTFIPVDGVLHSAFFNSSTPFWKSMFFFLTNFTAVSIQLAAPSLLAILMAEMFLGIANRLAPQVQIAFLGMSIKSLLGIALLYIAWFFIIQQMGKQFLIALKELDKILPTMRL